MELITQKELLIQKILELCEKENDISLIDLIFSLLATNAEREDA